MSLFDTPERTVMVEARDLSKGDVIRFRRRSGAYRDFTLLRLHPAKPDDPEGVREFALLEFEEWSELEPILAPEEEEFEVVLK